ncbi:MAG: NAD(P)/FAD-dependent oxidoreductase [Desulfobacterales bacterium]|nr:NAD(P)/FAD-dependent oxidoreductase [Desulfobacterales bacterium]
MNFDAVIVGAGPGGLSCAKCLAEQGLRVVILEKKSVIGEKVCAGGITWSGMINRLPEDLIERRFFQQFLKTKYQKVSITAAHPIVATVNRRRLGHFMAESATKKGAEIITEARVDHIDRTAVHFIKGGNGYKASYRYLIGADGSNSAVRRSLGLSNRRFGIGINYYVPQDHTDILWNFNPLTFGCGYSWIFPHRTCMSVGAYSGDRFAGAGQLSQQLAVWLQSIEVQVNNLKPQAEKISYDYQGWHFDRTYLVGDAAGLASPLTGEGIHPAIVSGEAAARSIIKPNHSDNSLNKLIKKHRKHEVMVNLACRSSLAATMLSELSAFLLRNKAMSFKTFEMA